MLRYYRLQPQGHLHSGLDDAKNIGRIVIELIKVTESYGGIIIN